MSEHDESVLIARGLPCDDCGSSDALAEYSDGHTFCYSCEKVRGGTPSGDQAAAKPIDFTPISGELQALKARGITEETCRKFGYVLGEAWHSGSERMEKAHICNVRDEENKLVAQKIRFRDKHFSVNGKIPKACLIGMHLWSGGRRLVVTEGEIDMLTVSQVQGNKYPVVSLPNGVQSAKRNLLGCIDFLKLFDEVVLCFDMDDQGREAGRKAAEALMGVVNIKIARLSMKDPNDMLLGGCTDELVKSIWNAEAYKPEGMVSLRDLRSRVMERKTPEPGYAWFLPSLTAKTYGRREGDVIVVGAGTGVGKTDFLTQQMEYDVAELDLKVSGFFMEQDVVETAQRLMGKHRLKRFHVPMEEGDEGYWTEQEYEEAFDALEATDKIDLFDSFGMSDWDAVKARMAYQAAMGTKVFYIDHLTALATGVDEKDEKAELERITAEMAEFAKQRKVILIVISHLTTPQMGKSHEEGGRVTIRQFKGSRAIGFWAYFMIGLERDQQADDETERTTTYVRVLKDRFTGNSLGLVVPMAYCTAKGIYSERSEAGDECPFQDQSGDSF
ncbi:DnaB-like helicase C-terminal domain-containing protein [Vibrio sp. SCSIO 43137]|uniref:DnaB-like helicase C-terminal domain-containing protein n=1 Tax=Vibrio sp. SCSIO 43137 TaxID=3021011 RepID=UPI002307F51F|nr:DnaB-like helicase C-terminal domain-containing protein [Vibrio sp. SCSIO 43137]WCE28439.1 DnaB-like helicase C-terminal domain-containing protein [Vibrio sp. SCSIO 43137]